MKNKKIKNSGLFLKAVVLAFAVFSLVSIVRLQSEINDKRRQLNELTPQIESIQANIDELNNLLENGSQESLIEKAAREKLGYVYADEQIYVDLSSE